MTRALTPAQKAAKTAETARQKAAAIPDAATAPTTAGASSAPHNLAATPSKAPQAKKKTVADYLLDEIPHSGTVTVGCKLPKGLQMRVFDWIEQEVPVIGGGTRVQRISQPSGEPVYIQGYAVPQGMRPNYDIIGDFALTRNVDAAFFRKWVEQNKELELVTQGLIFMRQDHNDAVKVATERAEMKCGLEPLINQVDAKGNAITDPRVPRKGHVNISSVGQADVRPA